MFLEHPAVAQVSLPTGMCKYEITIKFYLFYLYTSPPDSQESDGDVNT